MNQKSDSYFQNIISIIGLIAAFIAALIPAFGSDLLQGYFIDPHSILPLTVVTVVLGILSSWNVIENHRYVYIQLPSRKSNVRMITSKHIVWTLIVLALGAFLVFFSAKDYGLAVVTQGAAYFVFFLSVFSGFSLLIASARAKFEDELKKENLPMNILSTLEKNGLVSTKLKITDNRVISDFEFIQNELGLKGFFSAVRVVTVDMEGKAVHAVLNEPATELLMHNEESKK